MAKKKFKFVLNAPAGIIFSIVSILVFVLDAAAFKGKLVQDVFTACGNVNSSLPFTGKSPLDFIRLFTHVLGNLHWSVLFLNVSMVLILSPRFEERFGPFVMVFMAVIASLVSGVCCACISVSPKCGSQSLVFMMLFLGLFENFSKKEIHFSWILGVVAFFVFSMISAFEAMSEHQSFWKDFWGANTGTFSDFAGGLIGGVFGLMIAPKKKAGSKQESENAAATEADSEKGEPEKSETQKKKWGFSWWGKKDDEEKSAKTVKPAKSGKSAGTKGSQEDSDEEVIGTLEL